MHFLKCLELLNYLLERVSGETRKQVQVRDATAVKDGLVTVNMTLKDERIFPEIGDLIIAIDEIEKSGVTYLTAPMKNVIVEGLNSLKTSIGLEAYEYFKVNTFDVNDKTIPLGREIVEIALEQGALKV